jgi:hypothetical protein
VEVVGEAEAEAEEEEEEEEAGDVLESGVGVCGDLDYYLRAG